MPDEHVLCIPTSAFQKLGAFQGFSPDAHRYLDALLTREHLSFQPRSTVEDDPSFKQLIPYIILRCGGRLFSYRRRKGDARLSDKLSLGVGGHINADDAILRESPATWYGTGLRRELEEEVEIHCTASDARMVGLINDDSTDVGACHLGVVHVVTLQQPTVTARDPAIAQPVFLKEYEVRINLERFETWSQIAFDVLFAKG